MTTVAYATARPVDRLIGQYAESHRHPTNVLIHWICVPIIVWCVLAFLATLHPWAAYAFALASLAYYVTLSVPLALCMLAYTALALWSLQFVPHAWLVALVAFVVTWVFQFIGHHIEGKRPSFLQDLRFLLIGPVFLLSKAFRAAGLKY